MVNRNLIIGITAMILSVMLISSVHAASMSPETNINTIFFNITFDNVHGGVVSSLQYKGVEFFTGSDNGVWGTMGLRRSTYTGDGSDVCVRWAIDMKYQYDQTNHTVTVTENFLQYNVTIESTLGTSEVLGSGEKIVWEIPKYSTMIKVYYPHTAGNTKEFLYMPFIRSYNNKMSLLNYYTITGGLVTATPTPYCESKSYQSSLIDYKLFNGGMVGTMIYTESVELTSAYYGADMNTWQMHFPFTNQGRKMSMIFYG